MLKKFLRCISTLLVLVLLVNMVPVQALGSLQAGNIGQIDGTEKIETIPAGSSSSTEQATIVAEIPEGRSEYSKEFLLSNGLHMATVYAEAVHYEKDGKWEDIDNTLVANLDGTYKNTAGPWEVSFPQSFGSSQSISITKDGYTLSFGMPQRLTSGGNSGAVVMSADSTVETFAATQASTATAQLDSKADLLAVKAEAEHPETVLDKLSSRLTYENVHSDTNVVYDLDSDRVKESIILAKQDATLRGFSYVLNTGAMIPVLEEDGTILLYSEDQTQIVMVMPAPYLLDAACEISNDVAVTLTGSNGRYVMTYLLPQSWLAAEVRQWPVILDPVIQTSIDRSNIQDVLVCSNATISPYGSYLEVGYLSNRGISRTYVNFAELPPLTSADVVVKAEMQMRQMWRRSISVPAEVHKVTSQWDQEQITWGTQPSYDETIVDFVMGNNAVNYYWDVTDVVQEWYNDGEHFGLLFKTSDAIENAGVEKFRQFYSCNYGYDYRPVLNIEFRNNNGLEGWWDYSSASTGRAGTGSVNIYSGNLVWTRSDMGFGGNRMPVSIDYAYNTNDAANNSFGMGYGWRNSFNQLVYAYSGDFNGDGTISSQESYYIWEDSDGTKHYFEKESSNVYKEEDNSELTLNISGSGSSKTYTITDKNDKKSYFDTQGRLYKIENNQSTKSSNLITYQDTTSKLISTVTDGAGRVYQFHYGDDSLLDKVSFTGTLGTEITKVEYLYENGNLTEVHYKDGKTAKYTYTDNHLLLTAEDIDGYKLTYTYVIEESEFAPPRIQSVVETDLTDENVTVSGGKLSFAYEQNQTKVQSSYTNADNEEVTESTLYYQFNNYGNTVAIQDDEGRAQYADFARNDPSETAGKGNQLTLSSKLQNTVINYLSDSSFENSTNWIAATSDVCSISTTEHYLGSKSLKVTEGNAFSQLFTAKAGKTYTFSGYVKVISGTAELCMITPDSQHYALSTPESSSEWTRIQISYTNSTSSDQQVYAAVRARGTLYLDCVQVEQMPTASRYNLVNNGDFASSDGWTPTGLNAADVVTAVTDTHPILSPNAYKITGEYTTAKSVKQTITVSGGEGDSYVFGGWAMGQSASLAKYENNGVTKDFSIKCTIHYTDNTTEEQKVQFNTNVTQWQFVTGAIAAKKAYSSITIEAIFENNANAVYFDGLQLFKEEFGVSYTYDDDGNVISVIDLQQKNTTYEYSNNDLTKIMQDGKTKMEYTYDDYHNVLTATTDEDLVYNFEYDGYGNNTKVSITNNGQTISSIADYTDNGDLLEFTKDALGNQTTYGYNEQTGLLDWVQYPEDTAATRAKYDYDNMYRTASVEVLTDTKLHLSANYTYEDDLLKTIQTPSTTYTFTYGNFSLRTRVDIGDRNLVTYSYETGTNRLKKLDYGNGGKVEYTYDSQGRLIQEEYEDGETVSYAYDNSGNLATVTDSETGTVTTYYYDLLNRQSGYREKGADLDHTVKYEYDEDNNLASMTEVINGVTKTYSYTYDDDNRISSICVGDGTVTISTVVYTYDDFGRIRQKEIKNGDTSVLTENADFATVAANTSWQIENYNGYGYTYDNNGNITSITYGGKTTTYEYDSANQLIRENNQAAGFTHTWTYDNAGNILCRKEYLYTTDVIDEATEPEKTVVYEYGDGEWGDLLTSYDDITISYDEVGNPLNDGTWLYTWKHSKQLISMFDGNTTWNYTYNSNGLRTKRTNGSTTYNYVYNGSVLNQLTVGADVLMFAYDASGFPLSLSYNENTYYYVLNAQNDVVAIVSSTGETVVTYQYDAWGRILNIQGSLASTLGNINPLRYRGYVYDSETGLYYLQSRYYNPERGRFINADNIAYLGVDGTQISNNLFAYCTNNPVMGYDPGGNLNWGNIFKAAITVVAVTAAVVAVVATAGAVAVAAGVASTAAVTAAATGAAVGGIAAGTSEIVMQCATRGSDNLDYNAIAIETFAGSMHGAVDGVAATATSAGVRVGCKLTKVAVNTTASILHNSNAENKKIALEEVTETFAKSFAIQACLYKYDYNIGKLDNEVLTLYMLDGKIGYGITNMLLTAAIRIGSNIVRHAKGIISQVF